MTNLFKQLEPLINEVMTVQMTLSKKEGILTVCVIPQGEVNDPAAKQIIPIVLSGTAEEMDNGFVDAITKPLMKTAGLISNVAQFEKDLEEAEAATKMAKAAEEKKKKEEETKKKEAQLRKRKFDKLFAKANALMELKDYRNAIGALNEARELTDNTSKVETLFKQAVTLISTGQLFGEAEDYTKVKTNFTAEVEKEIAAEDKKGKSYVPVAEKAKATEGKVDNDVDEEEDNDNDNDN